MIDVSLAFSADHTAGAEMRRTRANMKPEVRAHFKTTNINPVKCDG